MNQITAPSSPDQVNGLINEISDQGRAFAGNEAGARETLLAKAQALVAAIESPMDRILSISYRGPAEFAAARIAIDLGIFDTLTKNGGATMSAAELSAGTGADRVFVLRVLRQLAASGLIKQSGPDAWVPSTLTYFLAMPKYRDTIQFTFDLPGRAIARLPAYVASTGYKNPSDPMDGPFQFAIGEKKHGWQYARERPQLMAALQNHMAGLRDARPRWTDPGFYPFAERLEEGIKLDGDAGAVVDVGGGMGHDLEAVMAARPRFPGKLVLQELPQVVARCKDNGKFEAMEHDFYKPQPVKGARAYLLHSILHGCSDEQCKVVLSHLRDAMEPGYSRLLVDELVVPEMAASWKVTSMDLYVMALSSNGERTEAQYRQLLETAGLEVTGIFESVDPDGERVIEAMRV
ncbi:S-adenosyl-L-methionine-dependent methyltransferase [Lineolata rhizophorae]|uniref:S-adenosyl-L-methionine-dependent methyltransferase n=1 Tax=Lineolata rhizophorae TaxID=578093 RepID=A0A6A6P2M3_9PEZI|nr:S-adenosyl-L-methionine-dependent methyltransferase [Lineolata rhizophorae]